MYELNRVPKSAYHELQYSLDSCVYSRKALLATGSCEKVLGHH